MSSRANPSENKKTSLFFLMYTNYQFEDLRFNIDQNDPFKEIWKLY